VRIGRRQRSHQRVHPIDMKVISNLHLVNRGEFGGEAWAEGIADPGSDVVLTIGTFDGVHRGHQHLLRQLVHRAQETRHLSVVLTFSPQPRLLLHSEMQPAYLTTPQEKAALLESLGLGLLVLLPFTRALAETPAETFVRALYDRLRMRELWVGAGFALGRGRRGDTTVLQALASQLGYVLRVVAPVRDDGQAISSTRIRRLLLQGQVEEAARLLGRLYALSGQVDTGAQRGRSLGIRTANLRIAGQKVLPANGVYAIWVLAGNERHQGVANLGVRPSFGGGERLLEAHLLDYDGDLYEKRLTVEFVQRLRPEIRFDDVDALVRQIHRDIADARAVLTRQQIRETEDAFVERA